MKKRGLAAFLACVMLAGCGANQTQTAVEPPAVDGPVIAYVPLDDRPDNAERVVYLANSLNYQLEMPEEDWYQTKLDAQPLNENGTQYGDRAKLYEWVLEQEKNGCDRYILFLDQLLSGGLVNSRHISGENPVTLSDGRVLTENELLNELMATLTADENNRVWLLDTVMRLAPTCGYDGFGIQEYNNLRAYGMQPRPVLEAEELSVENVLADYRLSHTGELLAPEEYSLTEDLVSEYLAARARKLELSVRMMTALHDDAVGNQQCKVLIGIDDSSAEDSIQKNEIAYLRSLLREGDALLSGVDDLAFKAVARLYLDECEENGTSLAEQGINRIYVGYFGGTEDKTACAYDSQPLDVIVQEHLEFFGFERAATREDADLQMLVLTQPKQEEAGTENWPAKYYEDLIACLKETEDLPTILMDAANNQYGTAFHDVLTEQYDLGQLLSYSGFLDMAIVTGTTLSHGAARYAWLAQGNGEDEATNYAFRKTVAEAILLDFCYRNTVRDELSAYVREQGGDPNNFYAPAIDLGDIQKKLETGMAESTKAVLKNLEKSNLITSLEEFAASGGTEGIAGWGKIQLSNWRFPWQRVFEVRMDLSLGSLTKPN